MSTIGKNEFEGLLLSGQALLDVRAETEFVKAHIPCARNIPILDDSQRKAVGTCYKQKGNKEATALGHELVSGADKLSKVQKWCAFLSKAERPVLYCARGGLRSSIAADWVRAEGIAVAKVEGGYKALRSYLLEQLELCCNELSLIRISGLTGSGKTDFLHAAKEEGLPILDLEGIANHRGSSFGSLGKQPLQATFENMLITELIRLRKANVSVVLVESESRSIGRVWLPDIFYSTLRNSPCCVLHCSQEERLARIHRQYVVDKFHRLLQLGQSSVEASSTMREELSAATKRIERRLGGLACQNILQLIDSAFEGDNPEESIENSKALHYPWIESLLLSYYDRTYRHGNASDEQGMLHEGPANELIGWLKATYNLEGLS